MLVGPIYKNQKKDVSGGEETCSNPKRDEMADSRNLEQLCPATVPQCQLQMCLSLLLCLCFLSVAFLSIQPQNLSKFCAASRISQTIKCKCLRLFSCTRNKYNNLLR